MKKLLLAFFLSLSVMFSLFAAQPAILMGKASNARDGQFILKEYGLPFNFNADSKVPIKEDGSFKVELDMERGQYYYIIYKRAVQLLFINPGETVVVNFDANRLNSSVTFGEDGKEVNEYLKKRFVEDQTFQQMVNYGGQKYGLYRLPWVEYETRIAGQRDKMQRLLDDFKKNSKIKGDTERFVVLEQAHIDAAYGIYYLQYPAHNAYLTKSNQAEQWNKLDLDMVDSKILKSDEDLLYNKFYRDFLNQYALAMSEKHFIESRIPVKDRNDFVDKAYSHIPNVFQNQWQVEYVQARVLYEHIEKSGINGMKAAVEDYRSQKVKVPAYQEAVRRSWDKWASTAVGQPAPEIIGKDITGKEVRLSDFKGKLVYIDVWATWCGPCRKEIPHLQKAESLLHGQDVVFLSVSIDNKKGKWKEMVKEQGLGGVQIHMYGGWSSEICKKYNITSIPRFMLIGKNGEIISVEANRPSQGAAAVIQKHL